MRKGGGEGEERETWEEGGKKEEEGKQGREKEGGERETRHWVNRNMLQRESDANC